MAGGAEQVTVAQLRSWIEAEQPGLPAVVQNLVIAGYAIQADKAWLRGDKPYPTPRLDQIASDMTLRSQELPTHEEFGLASARAQGIFGIARQPVRSGRSGQVLAAASKPNATG